MKVLVITSLYPKRYNPMAGVFVRDQVRSLTSQGAKVVGVVSPVPWSPPFLWLSKRWRAYGLEPTMWQDFAGVPVYQPRVIELPRLLGFPVYGWTHGRAMRRLVKQISAEEGFDLIHAHVGHPTGTAAISLGRELRVPVVLTVHGQDLQVSLHRNRFTRRVVFQTLGNADRVILVSEKLRRLAQEQGIQGRFTVIPNAIDSNQPVNTTLLDKLLGLRTPGTRLILSVGNLIPSKGQELVLRALGPDDHYWLVGDGPDRLRLHALARELGISDRVKFWGRVPHEDVSAFMRSADVFALPSSPEAFGVVYLEAMLAGIPVVACKGEGDPHLLEDRLSALLVAPGTPHEVAAALTELRNDEKLRADITREARARILERYTTSLQTKRILTLYQEVLS